VCENKNEYTFLYVSHEMMINSIIVYDLDFILSSAARNYSKMLSTIPIQDAINISASNTTTTKKKRLPAPIVSPPRRTRTLPISLFFAKGSIGIGRALLAPDIVATLNAIWTSADTPFVKTLVTKKKEHISKGKF
jgi:hypothetical protein